METIMSEKIRATVATEKNAAGSYDWVVTAVEGDIGSMPRIERSTTGFATEEEARKAGEQCVEAMRHD